MKTILFLFIFLTTSEKYFSQTLYNAFDNYELSMRMAQGQGLAYRSNVIGKLNNRVSNYLQSYLFKSGKVKIQDKRDSIESNKQKWTISVSAAPVITFYIKKDKDADRVYPFEKSPGYNYGASVLMGYKLSNRAVLLSGINYDILEYYFQWNISNDKQYSYKYLGIPLLLDFSFGQKIFFINYGFGLIGGIFVDKKNIYTNNINIIFDDSRGALMETIKIGANYRIKNGVRIFIASQIYYGLSTVTYQMLNFNGEFVGGRYNLKYFKINLGITYTLSK